MNDYLVGTSQMDAARGVIRFMLLKPDLAQVVFDQLTDPDVFEDMQLRRVFKACLSVYRAGDAISQATIRRAMESDGTERTRFLTTVFMNCWEGADIVSAPIVEGHVGILLDQYHTRRFKERAAGVGSFDGAVKLSQDALDWSAGIECDGTRTPAEVSAAIVEKQTAIYEGSVEAGYSWGLDKLDKHLRLELGRFYVIAGIKKGAKTHLLLQVLNHNLNAGIPCCLFSLEMNDEAIYRRLLAKRTGINSKMIHSHYLDRSDFDKLKQECAAIIADPFPLHIDDSPAPNAHDIVSRTRRWLYKNGITNGAIVAIDFLQLVRMDRQHGESEASAIKHTTYELARLAKSLGVVVIAVAQFRNEAEAQEPHIRFLEGSGAIAQAAEAITLIDLVRRRDPSYESEGELKDVNIIVAEQRSGESGILLPCKVNLATSTFYDTASGYEQVPF